MLLRKWRSFVKEEWLLVLAALGMLFSSVYLRRWPHYAIADFEVLYILLVLFVVTKGLQKHHVFENIARRLEQGRFIAVKLLVATFLFSMLVTNDAALLAVVPLTMTLRVAGKDWLVILEILAANAGSALSPVGNPQNLFIYWFYNIPFGDFVKIIAPFSAVFFLLLLISVLFTGNKKNFSLQQDKKKLPTIAYFYIGALLLFVLVIMRLLPLILGGLVILYALLADRDSLRVDYALLVTFFCFFGFTDNLQALFAGVLRHPHHVFLLAAFLSQVISNVPTALLLADFTARWQALLWGVSVGGFGSLIASLANLIAWRIYIRQETQNARRFTLKFHVVSYLAFFTGLLLYAALW